MTQEDNTANVRSDPGSPLFSCIFFSYSLSTSLLPRLSSPLLVYSPQFVNRSLLMWFAVCITALLSPPPPSLFLPPSLSLRPPACLPSLYLSPLCPHLSFAAASYYWSSCRADDRQADVETGVGWGCDNVVTRLFDWLHAICRIDQHQLSSIQTLAVYRQIKTSADSDGELSSIFYQGWIVKWSPTTDWFVLM